MLYGWCCQNSILWWASSVYSTIRASIHILAEQIIKSVPKPWIFEEVNLAGRPVSKGNNRLPYQQYINKQDLPHSVTTCRLVSAPTDSEDWARQRFGPRFPAYLSVCHNILFHRVVGDKPIDKTASSLAVAVDSTDGLAVVTWVPRRIKDHDTTCPDQVDPKTTRPTSKQTSEIFHQEILITSWFTVTPVYVLAIMHIQVLGRVCGTLFHSTFVNLTLLYHNSTEQFVQDITTVCV